MTHEFADRKLAYIRDLFVFASFTALSFVDIKELTTEKIDKDLTMFGNRFNQSFSEISIAM